MNNDSADDMRRALLAALPVMLLTDAALAQDAARVQPRAYKVVLENDRLRVSNMQADRGWASAATACIRTRPI